MNTNQRCQQGGLRKATFLRRPTRDRTGRLSCVARRTLVSRPNDRMSLISEIIHTLGTEGRSLTAGLLKTRALLRQSGNRELRAWVDCELLGYRDRSTVPSYRRVPADVFANVGSPPSQVAAHPIVVLHLPEEQRDAVACIHLTDAVGALEEFVASPEERFVVPITLQAHPFMSDVLPEDAQVQRAWSQCDRQSIVDALAAIRSRLLDFMCGLQRRLGPTEETDMAATLAAIGTRHLF